MIRLVVDNRERELYDCCLQKIETYQNISIEMQQLPLGDIEVFLNDNLVFAWERKTFADLLSSIKDGRYSEQSHRLENVYGRQKVVYLLEGILNQYVSQKSLIISTIASLMFYKGFHVFRSTSVQDSADCILLSCAKILKNTLNKKPIYYETLHGSAEIPEYSCVVKKEKKQNITSDNIHEIMLCQIPDVSHTSAKAIMNFAENDLHKLIEITRNSPEQLNTIVVGDHKRKISKKIISRLIEYLGKT